MADAGVKQIRGTYAERGNQYADTMQETKWLNMIAVAKQLGVEMTNDQARAIVIAGLIDIKYWRSLGGFKMDNLIDGASYTAYLIGELDEQLKK